MVKNSSPACRLLTETMRAESREPVFFFVFDIQFSNGVFQQHDLEKRHRREDPDRHVQIGKTRRNSCLGLNGKRMQGPTNGIERALSKYSLTARHRAPTSNSMLFCPWRYTNMTAAGFNCSEAIPSETCRAQRTLLLALMPV